MQVIVVTELRRYDTKGLQSHVHRFVAGANVSVIAFKVQWFFVGYRIRVGTAVFRYDQLVPGQEVIQRAPKHAVIRVHQPGRTR